MRVRVCPSGPLQLAGESGWEVYEEVSAILRQSCCCCSQRDSPGDSDINQRVGSQRVGLLFWSITHFTDQSSQCSGSQLSSLSSSRGPHRVVPRGFISQNKHMNKVQMGLNLMK